MTDATQEYIYSLHAYWRQRAIELTYKGFVGMLGFAAVAVVVALVTGTVLVPVGLLAVAVALRAVSMHLEKAPLPRPLPRRDPVG